MKPNVMVESRNPNVGIAALKNGFGASMLSSTITESEYVKVTITTFLARLVSHALSASTLLFRSFIYTISYNGFAIGCPYGIN